MKPSIYFRTDGNEKTGLGHLFRSLSLAEILEPAFDCTFFLSTTTPNVLFDRVNFLRTKYIYCDSQSEQQEIQWIQTNIPPGRIIVIDSYSFSNDYFSTLLNLGYKTIYIDDQDKEEVTAFGVINHIIGSERNEYRNVQGIQLLGTQYAILRKEFLFANKRCINENFSHEHVLICLGGADGNQITNNIVKVLLADWPQLKITVMVGASFTGHTELSQLTANGRVTIFKEKNAAEIVDAVSKASIAIITPGMISYEFFSVGIPALCGYISESQKKVVKHFSDHGLVANVNDFNREDLNYALQSMSGTLVYQQVMAQVKIFDGKSGDRLINAFMGIHGRA